MASCWRGESSESVSTLIPSQRVELLAKSFCGMPQFPLEGVDGGSPPLQSPVFAPEVLLPNNIENIPFVSGETLLVSSQSLADPDEVELL